MSSYSCVEKRSQVLLAMCILLTLSASCTVKPAGELTTPAAATDEGFLPEATPIVPFTPVPSVEATVTQIASLTAEPALEEYIVQRGDTLLGLAMEWGVPMVAIQLANDMGDSLVVKVGLPLSIPSPEGWEDASPFWVLHVVQAGETLSHISRRYGVSMERLQEVNNLSNTDAIRAGQELILPLKSPAGAVVPTPAATPVPPTPTTAPAPKSTAVVTEVANMPNELDAPPAVPAAPPPANVADWPRETVRLINDVRASHGLAAYVYNDILAETAQAHANDCAERGWCSHTGSDGSSIKVRVRRAGYSGVSWAECWAQRQTPQGAVDIWMDEVPPDDPHRHTLLHTWFTEIGIGIAETTWGYYYIADFGKP